MSNTCTRGFAVSIAVLFLASAVLAQEPEKKTPVPTTRRDDCEANNCISKVLYVPELPTPFELQDVVNTFRTIVDFTNIEHINPSDHTIALKGTAEQLAVAEKLLSVLESIRSSGGHNRSSVLVYQLKGRLSGTAQAERMLQNPRLASTICELTTCYIKAMYLPDLSMPELQNFTNRVRMAADLPGTAIIPSRHVLVIRGTSEQVTLTETLMNTSAAPVTSVKSPFQRAGINRHEAENAKFLRERISDPLGPEFCASPIAR